MSTRKRKRPIHDNLVRQLKLATEYRDKLYQLERESRENGIEIDLGDTLRRAEQDVDKLQRLTDPPVENLKKLFKL